MCLSYWRNVSQYRARKGRDIAPNTMLEAVLDDPLDAYATTNSKQQLDPYIGICLF